MTHFTVQEMERTDTGLPNVCPAELLPALKALCDLLELWRALLGSHGEEVRIHIDSGYRSPDVNVAVKGSAHSQHKRAEAADCRPDADLVASFAELSDMAPWIPLGQGILYPHSGFIHVSIDLPPNFRHDIADGDVQPRAPGGWEPRRELWVCVDPKRQAPLVPWSKWSP